MFVHDFKDLLIVFKALALTHAYLLSCQDENFKNSPLGNTNSLFPFLFLGNLNKRDIQYQIEYYAFEVLAGWNRRLDRSFHLFSPTRNVLKCWTIPLMVWPLIIWLIWHASILSAQQKGKFAEFIQRREHPKLLFYDIVLETKFELEFK